MDILTKHIIRMQYKSDTGNPSMIYIDDIDDQNLLDYIEWLEENFLKHGISHS